MGFRKEKKETEKVSYPQLSKKELNDLDFELKKYEIDIPLYKNNDGKPYFGIQGLKKWYVDNGALKDNSNDEWIILNGNRYVELQNKLNQHSFWLTKKEYAIRMSEKEYEEIFNQVQIDSTEDIPF